MDTATSPQAPAEGSSSFRRSALRVAAALSLAAALIHASGIAAHFQEYWLFGIFFASTAVFQLVWAGAVWGGAPGPDLIPRGAGAFTSVLTTLAGLTGKDPVTRVRRDGW